MALNPTLNEYFDAAFQASFDGTNGAKVTLLEDGSGQPVEKTIDQDGFSAGAFVTPEGQLIVAFAGTDFDALANKSDPHQKLAVNQVVDDYLLYQGYMPPAFQDALNFLQQAESDAASAKISTAPGNVFVDGHSLGGAIAAYVSAQTGLPGTTFAAPGLPPGAIPSGADGTDLTAYVESGDPIGNYGNHPDNDGTLLYNPGISRYGTTIYTGSQYFQNLEAQALASAASAYAQNKSDGLVDFALDAAADHVLSKYAEDLNSNAPSKTDVNFSGLQLLADVEQIVEGAASARLTVSLDSKVDFTDQSTAVLTGTVASPAGVRSVEISAQVDGTATDLGAATLNPDGTFSFTDPVGSHTQANVTATATDNIANTASQVGSFQLQNGKETALYGASEGQGGGLAGAALSSGGFHAVAVSAPGQTLLTNAYDVFENGGRGDTTFVFSPGFGIDVVKGFEAAGPDHDQVVLPSSDFQNLAAVFRNTGDVNGSAFITDPKTGDAIRLAGVTTAELKANPKDVVLVG